MAVTHLDYRPYPTTMQFHQEWHHYLRGIMGPFGSGKSVACVEELLFIAMRQSPAKDKVRYTRFGVVRATYPNLKTTTKKTMEGWYPRACGFIKETAPMEGLYRIPLPDGTTVNMELLLLAIETEDDVKKLRSTDFTAIWLNEATEVAPSVLDAATERVGRFPNGLYGECSWRGILMDYNKPPRGHWLHKLMETDSLPEGYKLYIQPPAMFKHTSEDGIITYEANPQAENLHNVGGTDYYYKQVQVRRAKGNTDEIDQLLCLLDVDDKRGKAVWPSFERERHVAKVPLQPIHGQDTIIAIDTSGIHPAALIAQFMGRQWGIIDELYGDGTGFEDFVYGALLPVIQTRYNMSSSVLAICDPANARNSLTATTPVATLQEAGIPAQVAFTNNPKSRIEVVSQMLNKEVGGFLISPTCELLIAACAGGYRYKKIAVTGTIDVSYSNQPEKNAASHPADALQYLGLHIMRVGESSEDQDSVRRQMARRLGKRKRVV